MLRAGDVVALLAAAVDAAVAARIPADALPAGAPRLALDVRAGRITHEQLAAEAPTAEAPTAEALELADEVAELLAFSRHAPAALRREGEALGQRLAAEEERRAGAAREALTPVGALDAWRRAVAVGQRTSGLIDPLYRAACLEARGLETRHAGLLAAAARDFADAAALLAQAGAAGAARTA
jgi:hypothetical protein